MAGPRASAECRLEHQPGTWRTQPLPLHPLLLSCATGIMKPVPEAQLLAGRERPRAWNRLPWPPSRRPPCPPSRQHPAPRGPNAPGARAGPLTLMIRSPSFTPAFTAAPPARGGSGQRGPPPVPQATECARVPVTSPPPASPHVRAETSCTPQGQADAEPGRPTGLAPALPSTWPGSSRCASRGRT